jgi:hypothetical protein
MLPRLFAITPSSPSASSPSPNPNPTPNPLSSLGTLISAHVAAHAEAQLQNIYADTLDHAAYLRGAADVEFHEVLEEQKLDIAMVKDDGVTELNRVLDDKLVEFKESVAEIVEDVGERAEMVYADVCERLDGLVGRERACLRQEREMLRCDRKIFEEEKRRSIERDTTIGRGRRAISLPL